MTCGWLNTAANRKCPIAAGSSIGIQWHHNSNAASDDIIDPTHIGPVMFYLAKAESNGAGNVWFKIYEDGYTPSTGKWAVNKLIDNKGRVDFTIPADIAPGNYLLRGEILALHNGYAVDGVQPYVGCVELTISGSGKANPAGVAFPGYYSNQDPGMLFNVYQAYSSYIIPGPAVYKGSSSSASGSSTASSSGSSTTSNPTSPPPASTTGTATSAPTSTPTGKPTSPPANGGAAGNIKVQLNQGTSEWWIGVAVLGGSETTVKVELTDAGSNSAWTSLVDMGYAYVFSNNKQLKAPISLRLTSSSGKQVVLNRVFTSFTFNQVDTGSNYGSVSSSTSTSSASTTAPTTKPTTAPTSAPTTKPTTGSSSGAGAKVTVHGGSSQWWFAVEVSGNSDSISSVEIKDSGIVSSFVPTQSNPWGYVYSAQGSPLVAPITVRITSGSKQVTATVSTITPNLIVDTNGQL